MSTSILYVNLRFPAYCFVRLLIFLYTKLVMYMVHPQAYPLTWLSCLKHCCDPQWFIWYVLVQQHQVCLLSWVHREYIPCATAAITFCTLPEHSPDHTATDYRLRIPICAAVRVLPQSRGHWAPMNSQASCASITSGCVLPMGRRTPQCTLWAWSHSHPGQCTCCTSAPSLPMCTRVSFSRKAGHTLPWCKPACPHQQTCGQKPWLWGALQCILQCTNSPFVWDKNLPSEKVRGQYK